MVIDLFFICDKIIFNKYICNIIFNIWGGIYV
nr:MAG TPA: hypothetical protein [Caudoviricetes sp.]